MKITQMLGATVGVAVTAKAGYKLFLKYGIPVVLTDDQIEQLDKWLGDDPDEFTEMICEKIDRFVEKHTRSSTRNRKERQARLQTKRSREEFFAFQKECKTIGDYILLMEKANALAMSDPFFEPVASDLNLAMKKYI